MENEGFNPQEEQEEAVSEYKEVMEQKIRTKQQELQDLLKRYEEVYGKPEKSLLKKIADTLSWGGF